MKKSDGSYKLHGHCCLAKIGIVQNSFLRLRKMGVYENKKMRRTEENSQRNPAEKKWVKSINYVDLARSSRRK